MSLSEQEKRACKSPSPGNGTSRAPQLRTRLILAFVAFVVPMIALSGLFYYEAARRSLDTEMGERLIAVAQVTAVRFNPVIISSFEPGDEKGRAYLSYQSQLIKIKDSAGLKRIYLFDGRGRSLMDTEENVTIGTPYARLLLQQRELESCAAGRSASSVLFRGDDGVYYKSGFAPIQDESGKVVAFVGADASASYLSLIQALRRSVVLFVIIGVTLTVLIGFMLARTIAAPLHRLANEAERIGMGRMHQPVLLKKQGSREVASLAEALNRMRERLDERDQNLRLMVAGVAHEIRNPLGGLELFASLARQEVKKNPEASAYLDRVIDEVGSLKQIVSHFLEYARPAPPAPVNLDLEKVVAQSMEMLGTDTRAEKVRFEVEISPSAAGVRADPDQLARVLLNLFANALAALPATDGLVRVSSSRETTGMVAVEVEDNGCGMDKTTREQVFTPFFTTREDGVGLGLAIVKKMVEENQGSVSVRSAPGKGACFRITLPASAPESGKQAGEKSSPQQGKETTA